MVESLTKVDYPRFLKNSPERRAVAERLRVIRYIESENPDFSGGGHRAGEIYLHELKGLKYFFGYVRNHVASKVILDIGANTTRGVYDLSKLPMAERLSFRATVLHRRKEIGAYLGYEKTSITSAEVLRGFRTESVGGIIALHSLSYSASPELAISRIDEVLAPGGVLKATFTNKFFHFWKRMQFNPHINLTQTRTHFVSSLEKLDYDIAVIKNRPVDIVLAIKPGAAFGITAESLLFQDARELSKQN